jgi:hypothetical protein
MDPKDKAIQLLVMMLRDIVDAAESRDEIKLGEQVAAAKAFLAQATTQSSGVDLPESCRIGESLDVQVTRNIS